MRKQTRETATALGEAFSRAGFRPEDVAFDADIARYLNNGGTIERAFQRLEAIAERLSGGHCRHAANGQIPAAAGQPELREGPAMTAVGHRETADPQPHTDGEARNNSPNGHSGDALAVRSVREPSPSEVQAKVTARSIFAKSIFDTAKTSSGRPWGQVLYAELPELSKDGFVAAKIKNHLGSLTGKKRTQRISDLMTERDFGLIWRHVTGVQNAN